MPQVVKAIDLSVALIWKVVSRVPDGLQEWWEEINNR